MGSNPHLLRGRSRVVCVWQHVGRLGWGFAAPVENVVTTSAVPRRAGAHTYTARRARRVYVQTQLSICSAGLNGAPAQALKAAPHDFCKGGPTDR